MSIKRVAGISSAMAGLVVAMSATSALAQTEVKFTLDWKFEGPAAPFLVALDKRTGQQRWRVARAEDTSWATPMA